MRAVVSTGSLFIRKSSTVRGEAPGKVVESIGRRGDRAGNSDNQGKEVRAVVSTGSRFFIQESNTVRSETLGKGVQ